MELPLPEPDSREAAGNLGSLTTSELAHRATYLLGLLTDLATDQERLEHEYMSALHGLSVRQAALRRQRADVVAELIRRAADYEQSQGQQKAQD